MHDINMPSFLKTEKCSFLLAILYKFNDIMQKKYTSYFIPFNMIYTEIVDQFSSGFISLNFD